MYLKKEEIIFIDVNTKQVAKKYNIDADDLRQNVYLRLLERKETERIRKAGNINRYIRVVIKNTALKMLEGKLL